MKKIKLKAIKPNKKTVISFILGAVIFSSITAGAASLIYSKDVTYDNSKSGLSSTTVQGALDELYESVKNGDIKVSCNDNGECTVTCKQGEPTISNGNYSCTTTTTTTKSVTCPEDKIFIATSNGYKCFSLPVNESVVTSGDGLYTDSTEVGSFYYSGANSNNAIVFNGEPYRILRIENDGRIKIIKMAIVGDRPWNTSGINGWENSSLKSYLEKTWLPTQENGTDYQYLATNSKWYVGGVGTSSSSNFTTSYTEEKSTSLNLTVGLISASEYLKSKYNTGSTFLSYSSSWWTISRDSTCSNGAWYVIGGRLSNNDYVSSYDACVFPVLYLKSDTTLTGSGTSTDPYCITGSKCPKNLDFTQRTK